MINKYFYIILFCIVTIVGSCSSENDAIEPYFGFNYSPLKLGQERIYRVDSIRYNDFTGRIDSSIYFRREVVESLNIEQDENRKTYTVGIYQRTIASNPWVKTKVIRNTLTLIGLERLEDNFIERALIFPVKLNAEWNGNALNANEEKEYKYADVHKAYSINDIAFDSVLTVIQVDEENLIEKRFTEEKFATGIGLIERKVIDIETELDGEVKRGFEANISLVSTNFSL